MRNKKFKKILQFAKDEWYFRVDLLLDDFEILQKRVEALENKRKEIDPMIVVDPDE